MVAVVAHPHMDSVKLRALAAVVVRCCGKGVDSWRGAVEVTQHGAAAELLELRDVVGDAQRETGREPAAQLLHERALLGDIGHDALCGIRRRRCTEIGHVVEQRVIVLVSDGADDRGGCRGHRTQQALVAEAQQLQRIAAESTEGFHPQRSGGSSADASQEDHLRLCNGKLSQWMDTWQHEMRRANGEKFHYAFVNLFRLHIRLFLNSFAVQASMLPGSRVVPSPSALSACFTSALEMLQIVVKDFASESMLRYSQDSITVMTAYAAVFLLKLLRCPITTAELHDGAAEEIHSNILRVADSYYEISKLSAIMGAAAHHARFLRGLVEEDVQRLRLADSHRRPYGVSSGIASVFRP